MYVQITYYNTRDSNRQAFSDSYVDPDGKTHTVTYIAGAGIGFQPTGDDIHPEVSAAVELNLKNPPQETEKV